MRLFARSSADEFASLTRTRTFRIAWLKRTWVSRFHGRSGALAKATCLISAFICPLSTRAMLKMSGHEHFTDSTEDFGAGLSKQGRRRTATLDVFFFSPKSEFSVALINRFFPTRDHRAVSVHIINCCAGLISSTHAQVPSSL